jgi:hypothetical protein
MYSEIKEDGTSKGKFWPIVGWVAYGLVAVVCTFVALMEASPWFALALALAFIFGPKLWRRL